MKCPKCSYIGFEPTDRCRNCGFDFSLAPLAPPIPDLPLRSAESMGPFADFDLGDAERPLARTTPPARAARRRMDPPFEPGISNARPTPLQPDDLPLFGGALPDDVPLVRPSAPSAPLAVRRSTPVPSRSRQAAVARVSERQHNLGLLTDSMTRTATAEAPSPSDPASADGEIATLGARVGAAALDWAMLVGLDLAVIYFTLRVSRLAATEVMLLPPVPLVAFLLLLNGGYLALFTAACGQTVGKMAFGVKVVSCAGGPLTIPRAILRVGVFLLSALPAGLGLLPAVFDRSRRGLHDRLAATRVVRTTAS